MKKLHNKTDTDTIEHAVKAIEIETYYKNNPFPEENSPEIKPLYAGILFSREQERKRITERLYKRLKEGMIEEVQELLNSGIDAETLSYYGLEYRYITAYLTGKLKYDEMVSLLNIAIHQFAKRQRTWFRKMEREGCKIHWFDGDKPSEDHISAIIAMLEL